MATKRRDKVNDCFELAFSFAAGLCIGGFYFMALWWTVKQLWKKKNQARLLLMSLIIRFLATIAGFFLVMGGHWERLLAAFAGFLLVRILSNKAVSFYLGT
jgi:F1F0 ATPase subunit 2